MGKEELRSQFEKNVAYLQRNIPPDDIYMFCEQTFMSAIFFLKKLCEHVNIDEEMTKDSATRCWVKNIISFQLAREQNIDVSVNLDPWNLND